MRVINLLDTDFSQACGALSDMVASSYRPDLIIGVLTGGGAVGKIVYEKMVVYNNSLRYTEVKLQRGSTKVKEYLKIGRVLHKIPRCILNMLKIFEAELLELKARIIKPNRYGTIELKGDIDSFLMDGNKKILLIDDCVDTGLTLQLIKDYIDSRYDFRHTVKTAVITKAHRKPILDVDYKLYDRVIVRFPWSHA